MCFATHEFEWFLSCKDNFQFPSHRDVLCDFGHLPEDGRNAMLFQFPSHRDVLCDRCPEDRSPRRSQLSVPFSSGCALRQRIEMIKDAEALAFSSLLIGMCFATGQASSANAQEVHFQFPSHRDVLCDPLGPAVLPARLDPFSSLLIGMCFATDAYLMAHMRSQINFQFPSHRDVLCDFSFSFPN